MDSDDIKIELVKISEALKYIDKRLDTHEEDIKNLHRENAKQSEEIKDAVYLSETLKINLEVSTRNCAESKEARKEAIKELETRIKVLQQDVDKASSKKLILIVEVVTGTLISILALIGSIKGWIKLGW